MSPFATELGLWSGLGPQKYHFMALINLNVVVGEGGGGAEMKVCYLQVNFGQKIMA